MNQSDENDTTYYVPGIPNYIQTSFIILYTFIIIIATGGNGIVCYLVYAYKRMRTVPNYFLVNLAISDIIMAIFCIPFTFVANLLLNYWPFGDLMCPIVSYLQIVSVFLSAHTLTAMSLDRYIVIVHPFRGRITTRNTMFVILAIWLLALSVPVPTLFRARVMYYSNTSGQCLEIWDNDNTGRYAYSLGIMILHYFAPLLVLMFCYITIGYSIWLKNIQGDERNKRKLQLASAKQKMIKMMLTVVIFYALCWLPFHVLQLVGDQDQTIYNKPFMPTLWVFFHWLAMSNSCYNPIIYIWMSPKFRAGLQLALHKCTRRKLKNCDSEERIPEFQHLKQKQASKNGNNTNNKYSNALYQFRLERKERMEKTVTGGYMLPGKIHSDT